MEHSYFLNFPPMLPSMRFGDNLPSIWVSRRQFPKTILMQTENFDNADRAARQNWPESKSTGKGTVRDHNTCPERTALIHLRLFNVRGAAHADHHQEGYPSGPDGAGEQRGRYCRPPDSPTVPGEEDDRAVACARHSTTSAAHRNGKREDYPR